MSEDDGYVASVYSFISNNFVTSGFIVGLGFLSLAVLSSRRRDLRLTVSIKTKPDICKLHQKDVSDFEEEITNAVAILNEPNCVFISVVESGFLNLRESLILTILHRVDHKKHATWFIDLSLSPFEDLEAWIDRTGENESVIDRLGDMAIFQSLYDLLRGGDVDGR
jgi:hypothetical protein